MQTKTKKVLEDRPDHPTIIVNGLSSVFHLFISSIIRSQMFDKQCLRSSNHQAI